MGRERGEIERQGCTREGGEERGGEKTKREKRRLIGHIGSGTDCWIETRMAKMSLFFLMKIISPYPSYLPREMEAD